MTISEQLPLGDVRDHLSQVVDRIEREHGRVIITRHGRPAAVVLSLDDLESLEETISVLASPGLRADLREAAADEAEGRTTRLTKDEALREITTR
jgi:antitoxin YefM